MTLLGDAVLWAAVAACAVGAALWLLRRARVPRSVAFFHPNCLSRGGGEFVLWAALSKLARDDPTRTYVVYTSTRVAPEGVQRAIEGAMRDFGLADDRPDLAEQLAKCVRLVHVPTSRLVFRPYPHLTLLLQSLAGLLAGLDALVRFVPDVFIETTGGGAAFALPVFRYVGGCSRTLAYVHYPTITSKMASDVADDRAAAVCNQRALTPAQRAWKLRYYRAFERLYRLAGGSARLAMANGSWTAGHLRQLWPHTRVEIVYPPCSLPSSSSRASDDDLLAQKGHSPLLVVSIGQYRPEKQHLMQVDIIHRLILAHPEYMGNVQLVMIGSVRGPEDAARRAAVEEAAAARGLLAMGAVLMPEDVNAAQKALYLRKAAVGLHCMCDEHFGICVVEYMAAGAVPLAHDSAGPRMDIVVPAVRAADIAANGSRAEEAVGMLATTVEEYVECLHALLSNETMRAGMARRAAARARTFSVDAFEQHLSQSVAPFLDESDAAARRRE